MFDAFLPLRTAINILADYGWVYLPVLLFLGAWGSWMTYIKRKYLLSMKWDLLELKPPPDVEKSPKIAENIFSGLHSLYIKPVSWKKRFFKGEVQPWLSFEIAGNGGDISFFVRTPESLRDLVEVQFFAQYPDIEIKAVDDYTSQLPKYLPNDEYDLFGTELILAKADAYPIKTYPSFEEESGRGEFKRTDPLAPLLETMSLLQPGEHIWVQLVSRATGSAWVKEAQPEVNKLIGKEPKPPENLATKILNPIDSLLLGTPEQKKEEKGFELSKLTPGQKFVLERVESKLSKLGFKTGYRFLYISRKEIFHRAHVSAILGMFKQFSSHDLNSFKPNKNTATKSDGWFSWLFPSGTGWGAKKDEYRRKLDIYQNYRDRAFVKQHVILNTEELATLFHMPGIGVKAPSLPRVGAKKGQPPIGLPTK